MNNTIVNGIFQLMALIPPDTEVVKISDQPQPKPLKRQPVYKIPKIVQCDFNYKIKPVSRARKTTKHAQSNK